MKPATSSLTTVVVMFFCLALTACPNPDKPEEPKDPPVSTEPQNPPVGAGPVQPSEGCFVQIWEDENFTDTNDIIRGPGKFASMRGLPGANKNDWGDEIDSLKVGPRATVRVWEDENFEDNSTVFGPGTEKTNLRGDPDFGDNIDSMEITCS